MGIFQNIRGAGTFSAGPHKKVCSTLGYLGVPIFWELTHCDNSICAWARATTVPNKGRQTLIAQNPPKQQNKP